MFRWSFLKTGAALSLLLVVIAFGLAFKQWLEGPIAIRPFTLEGGSAPGIPVAALSDQAKAHISTIYAKSGDLFETRKLGEPTVPLDVKIGDTGWDLQSLTSAFGVALTSADVSGRIVKDGDRLILQWTTMKDGGVAVDNFPILSAGSSLLPALDRALECLALRTVAGISPDVAANYLHTQDEVAGGESVGSNTGEGVCLSQDDVGLYSQVSEDESKPPAARVNALVGLSVHFSYTHQVVEELGMAVAATHLAARTLSCDDQEALPSRWKRLKCTMRAYRPFSDKNLQAQIAAWMQQGAAYSDYAAVAPTLGEMTARRNHAIDAYAHVISIKKDYALAYDAKGLQQSLLHDDQAAETYARSLKKKEMPATQLDFGILLMRGRNDYFVERDLNSGELADAEAHLRKAIELSPDYWDAYGELGWVLYKAGSFTEAADVLETAVQHASWNRHLRLLLSSVYAARCRLDAARTHFQRAFAASVASKDYDAAWNMASDWGAALQGFGFRNWAIAQESELLAINPKDVNALRIRGESEIESADMDPSITAAGLADLKAAVDNDASKSDEVLKSYLAGLLHAERTGDAVANYESWSRDGIVPPLATGSALDAGILPRTDAARLTYARALLRNHQWESAAHELEVLFHLGMAPAAEEVADLRAQAANPAAAGAISTRLNALINPVASLESKQAARKECHVPDGAQPPLLTDDPAPLQQVHAAAQAAAALSR